MLPAVILSFFKAAVNTDLFLIYVINLLDGIFTLRFAEIATRLEREKKRSCQIERYPRCENDSSGQQGEKPSENEKTPLRIMACSGVGILRLYGKVRKSRHISL